MKRKDEIQVDKDGNIIDNYIDYINWLNRKK